MYPLYSKESVSVSGTVSPGFRKADGVEPINWYTWRFDCCSCCIQFWWQLLLWFKQCLHCFCYLSL